MKVKEFLKPTKGKIWITIVIFVIILAGYHFLITNSCKTEARLCFIKDVLIIPPGEESKYASPSLGRVPLTCYEACTQEEYNTKLFQQVIPTIILPILLVSYLISCTIFSIKNKKREK